jgi:hypothetical protein
VLRPQISSNDNQQHSYYRVTERGSQQRKANHEKLPKYATKCKNKHRCQCKSHNILCYGLQCVLTLLRGKSVRYVSEKLPVWGPRS